MRWNRRPKADLNDIVELLEGIGTMLMVISAKVETVVRLLKGDDDEEADA